MPENVHLLTLEPWKPNQILVRFEHILALGEDEQLAKPATFDFMDVFRQFDIVNIRETTLAANQWLSDSERFKFTEKANDQNEIASSVAAHTASQPDEAAESTTSIKPIVSSRQYYGDRKYGGFQRNRKAEADMDNTTITLSPMEIRTFVVDIEPKLSN